MIIELPLLSATPPSSTPNVATLQLVFNRWAAVYAVNQELYFYAIMPSNYNGNSLDIKLHWLYTTVSTVQTCTWGVSIQKLIQGSIINSFLFSTERTGSGSTSIPAQQVITTINIPEGDLNSLVIGDMFRLRVRLTVIGSAIPNLMNVVVTNGT